MHSVAHKNNLSDPHGAIVIVKTRNIALGCLVLTVAGLSGCANITDRLRVAFGGGVEFVQPPSDPTLRGLHTVTVTADGSPASTEVAGAISGDLQRIAIDQKPDFTLVRNQAALELDVAQANVSVQTTPSVEIRVICPNHKLVCHDDQAEHYSVNCLTRQATASASLGAERLPAHGALFQHAATASASAEVCSDTGGQLPQPGALLGQAIEQLDYKLIGAYLPRLVKQPIDVGTALDGASDATNAQLARAAALLKNGDVPGALAIYHTLLPRDAQSKGQISFDIGYCDQAEGAYAKAMQAYTRAQSLGAANLTPVARYMAEDAKWVALGYPSID